MITKIPILISFIIISLSFFVNCGGRRIKFLNIKYLTQFSSHVIKELNVHGLDSIALSIDEAKKTIRDVYKINEINMIKDDTKRNDAWAENLNLRVLEEKLYMIEQISYFRNDFQHRVLENGGDLISTMAHLSMLDTSNKKSPFFGKNYDAIIQSINEDEMAKEKLAEENLRIEARMALEQKENDKAMENQRRKMNNNNMGIIPNCIKVKPKFSLNNRAMRLLYSKVIPPGKKLPNSHRVVFTDNRGRTCRCSC